MIKSRWACAWIVGGLAVGTGGCTSILGSFEEGANGGGGASSATSTTAEGQTVASTA